MIGADVAIVGTGPNGLAAGVTLARAGLTVALYEAADDIGGGLRSKPLFDSEIVHDMCAAVHPMAAASRFFREFDLAGRGVELRPPEISYAHPLDGAPAALAFRDLEATCAHLGGADGRRWRRLMRPLLDHSEGVVDFILGGQRSLPRDPVAPLLLARRILTYGTRFVPGGFSGEAAKALLTGVASHAIGKLPSLSSGAVALLLGHLAHGTGWPLPRGGSAVLAEAMVADITAHGGTFHTGRRITDLREVAADVVLLDITPKGFLDIAHERLPRRYARQLRAFRYGPAAAKVDFLVSEPIPWADPEVGRAGTVHLGGTRAEMWRQESGVARGRGSAEPFVLLVDPAVTDPERARPGRRPVWAYAHVPNGDGTDPVDLVQARIERYAPGFGDTVIERRGISGLDFEAYNANYVGGDISAGAITLKQSILRPVPRFDPYRTPLPGVYLCSASTPPGPSVHGLCGYYAALSALRREFHVRTAPSLAPGPGVRSAG